MANTSEHINIEAENQITTFLLLAPEAIAKAEAA
jgi:hypothetical protein